ncbi:MAG: hypothetical protein J5702_05530 [Bacteroidales bacterium]|nr:hypothetical protein [Bacteroidales bacterium]
MKTYISPETEVFEVCPAAVICQSPNGVNVTNYGDNGAPGGGINDDNYIDGGVL